jgi:ATP-dependent Clp protease ATP-binding subunit ClpA
VLPPSLGLRLAYEIAVLEAVHGRHEFVEPEHCFIAVCKVGNLAEQIDWQQTQLSAEARRSFEGEIKAVIGLFEESGLDRVELYREVRERLGTGSFRHQKPMAHRTSRTRAAFDRALGLAHAAQAMAVYSSHLLSALLDDPGEILLALLRARKADPQALQQRARRVTLFPNASTPEGEIRFLPPVQPAEDAPPGAPRVPGPSGAASGTGIAKPSPIRSGA